MKQEDEVTIAAHAIVVHHAAVEGLNDLQNLQVPVPFSAVGNLRRNLTSLAQVWWATTHGDPVWHDSHLDVVVREAHEWLESNSWRLQELRTYERENA